MFSAENLQGSLGELSKNEYSNGVLKKLATDASVSIAFDFSFFVDLDKNTPY